jgi:hypothetical protein
MLKGLLVLLGLLLLGAGGWMQLTKPDYRRVHEFVPVGPPLVSKTEPQPVPNSLIAVCFITGLALLGVGIATK